MKNGSHLIWWGVAGSGPLLGGMFARLQRAGTSRERGVGPVIAMGLAVVVWFVYHI